MAATHDFRKGIHFEHKSVVMLANEYLDYFSCALRRLTMLGKRKKPFLMMKVFVVFVFFAFATAGFAARIVPTGTVSIIENSKVIGKFSQEAPLPEGVLLRCEGNCAVKLDDVYMTVKPKTVFSVSPMADRHDVLVQQGTVYYSLNESSRPLHFDTPAENMTTGDLYMTDDELRGYVRVVGNDTEIGVLSGGSMMLETGSGEMAVLSGKKITITLADSGKTAPANIAQEGLSTNRKYIISAIEVSKHPEHGDLGGGDPGGGDPGGGDPGGGDPGGGDPGGGDPGGGDPGGGDPGGGDPDDGDPGGGDPDDGGKGGDKGGGKGGDKGGGKGGDKGGGKGGDKGGGKGGGKK